MRFRIFLCFSFVVVLTALCSSCVSAVKLEQQGIAYIESKSYSKAIDTYDKLIGMQPQNPLHHYNRAIAAFNLKRYTEAELYASRCIALAPEMYEGYALHGHCMYMLKSYKAALASQDRALEIQPQSGKTLLDRGITNLALKDCRNAVKDLDNALRFKADTALTLYNRGIAHNRCQLHGLALDDFNASLKLWPDSHFVVYARGLSYMKLGGYEEAVADFLFAVKHHVKEDTARAHLAFSYLQMNDTANCMDQLQRTLAFNPRFEYSFLLRSEIYYGQKQYKKATDNASEVLRLNDTCFRALQMNAAAYSELGEPAKAEEFRERMRKLRPGDPELYFELFRNYNYYHLYDNALASIDRCIEIQPESYSYRLQRVKLLYEMKRFQLALAAIYEAEKSGPVDDTMMLAKGGIYYELGSFDTAIIWIKKAIEINPENRSAQQVLYGLYIHQNREKEARVIMEEQLAHHPEDSVFLRERIRYARRDGNNKQALKDMEKLLSIYPDYDTYMERAHLLRSLMKYAEAATDYAKAGEMKPGESGPLLYRGDCFDLLGKKTLACAEWKKACALGNKEGCLRSGSECR